MNVPRLQTIVICPALRRLQKVVCNEFQILEIPKRFTPLKIEDKFQLQVKRIIKYVRRFLALARSSLKGEGTTQSLNISMFETWMSEMYKFTSLRGLMQLRHRDWCRSRVCLIYSCQFRTKNDEGSVTVYPNWLDIRTGPHNIITEIYDLDEPRW